MPDTVRRICLRLPLSVSTCPRPGDPRAPRTWRGLAPCLFRLSFFFAPSHGRRLRVGDDIGTLRVRRGFGDVVVVPVPPLVRRALRVTRWRVLPRLLAAERRGIEVAPDASHRLVAAVVDEVGAKHL